MDEIWSTLSSLLGLALADFGLIRAVARAEEPGKIIFLSGKHRTIILLFRRPNLTKVAHNKSIGEKVKSFGTEFEKNENFTVRGRSPPSTKI